MATKSDAYIERGIEGQIYTKNDGRVRITRPKV